MSNTFKDQIEDQTGGASFASGLKHAQWEKTGYNTPLSHKNKNFNNLLRNGNLDYLNQISKKVQLFRSHLDRNKEYYDLEGSPILSSNLIDIMEFFFFELFEKQIQNDIVVPLYSISYSEGFDGSIELSLKLPKYRILFNISSTQILYSILHRINHAIVKKGSNTIDSISENAFIENIVSDIKYFEEF